MQNVHHNDPHPITATATTIDPDASRTPVFYAIRAQYDCIITRQQAGCKPQLLGENATRIAGHPDLLTSIIIIKVNGLPVHVITSGGGLSEVIIGQCRPSDDIPLDLPIASARRPLTNTDLIIKSEQSKSTAGNNWCHLSMLFDLEDGEI